MACLISRHIFGGGPYSTTHSRMLRMVGRGQRQLFEIEVDRSKPSVQRLPSGVVQNGIVRPFMPESLKEKLHPGGNSVCYQIQIAHLMGCDPIYLLGFTLESGSGYFFGLDNPVSKIRSAYEKERPLHWLRWYQGQYPGRVQLWPGWQGPIYEVFDEAQIAFEREEQPDQEGRDVSGVQQPEEGGHAPSGDDR